MRHLLDFILRFMAGILAVCISIALATLVFWAVGGLLFHWGIISDDAILFSFPLYGILPGFIVGGVCYAAILVSRRDSK